VIQMLSTDYPVQILCEVIALPRSSYYYLAVEHEDAALKAAIESVAAEFPTYGSRRVTAQLKRIAPGLLPRAAKRCVNKRPIHSTPFHAI